MTIDMEHGSERYLYERQILDVAKIEIFDIYKKAIDRGGEYYYVVKSASHAYKAIYDAVREILRIIEFLNALKISFKGNNVFEGATLLIERLKKKADIYFNLLDKRGF